MAVSLAAAQGTELPAHLVSDVTDPWTCPAELLPFLALERSVDLWKPDWTEERQRWVIAEQARLHRLKTTEAGFKAHLTLVGAELVHTLTPRTDFFAAPEFGEEDRKELRDEIATLNRRIDDLTGNYRTLPPAA